MKLGRLPQNRKGVQTIVIVIIILAVVVAAAVVAGFMLGLFGTPTESLHFVENQTHLVHSSHFAIIVVQNTGTADAQIVSVKIGNQTFTWPGGFTTPGNDNIVQPNVSEGINIVSGVNVTVGTGYAVEVKTQAGNTIQATIIAE